MYWLRTFSFFLLVLITTSFFSCNSRPDKHKPVYYFPIQPGNTWIFNGEIHKMEITAVTQSTPGKAVTLSVIDTNDVSLWKEQYRLIDDQLYFESFLPGTFILPNVTFDPPLPFAPFSTKPGATITLEGKEIHSDSTITEMQIVVNYEIEAIEDVKVPAGLFRNCIKMKISVEYPTFTMEPYFIGDQHWWFAPIVGPVKYDLPSASGELVDISLNNSQLTIGPG